VRGFFQCAILTKRSECADHRPNSRTRAPLCEMVGGCEIACNADGCLSATGESYRRLQGAIGRRSAKAKALQKVRERLQACAPVRGYFSCAIEIKRSESVDHRLNSCTRAPLCTMVGGLLCGICRVCGAQPSTRPDLHVISSLFRDVKRSYCAVPYGESRGTTAVSIAFSAPVHQRRGENRALERPRCDPIGDAGSSRQRRRLGFVGGWQIAKLTNKLPGVPSSW
jgi:hypothetical protein